MEGINTKIDNVRIEMCNLINEKIQDGIPLISIKNILELLVIELNMKLTEVKKLESEENNNKN